MLPNTQTPYSPKDKELLSRIKEALSNRDVLASASLPFFMVDTLHLEVVQHHFDWADLQAKQKFLKIEGARDVSGKTYFWSYSFPLWTAKYNSGFNIGLISYSLEQVQVLTTHIQQAVETNPDLAGLIPKTKETWTKTHLKCANGTEISGKSFGSPIRSGHFDLIIVDDPIKDYGGMNRQDQLRFFKGVIMPALKPGGQLIVVGTPIDADDLLLDIEQNSIFHCAKYPAINTDGSSLWPARWSIEALMERKAGMGSWLFDREYMLRRVSSEIAPLKKAWLRYYDALPEGIPVNIFMADDPALSTEETANYTAIVVGAVTPDNSLYLLEITRKRLSPFDHINELFRLYFKWRPKVIGLETVAFQEMLKAWIYEESKNRCKVCGKTDVDWTKDTGHTHIKGASLPIVELAHNKASKTQRIMSIQSRLEAGRLFIRPTMTDLEKEIENYRTDKDGQDDILDAVASFSEIISLPISELPPKYSKLPGLEQRVWTALDRIVEEQGAYADEQGIRSNM